MSEVTSASKATSDKKNASTESTPKKKSWFKGLKSEFKKIIWPEKKHVATQTIAVTIIIVVLGVVISVMDNLIMIGLDLLF